MSHGEERIFVAFANGTEAKRVNKGRNLTKDENADELNSAVIYGRQREIACECWFTSSGSVIPLMLKVKDEDGEIRVIRQIKVHSQQQKLYAGMPSIEFDCTLTVLGQAIRARLIYYQTKNKWVLNFQ